MTSDKLTFSDKFKTNIIALLDIIHELLEDFSKRADIKINPQLVMLGKSFINTCSSSMIIDTFIDKSFEHWDRIKTRDEKFFVENCDTIFGDIPLLDTSILKTIYETTDRKGSQLLSDDDKETLWKFFESMVKLSLKHIHEQREPVLKMVENRNEKLYSKKLYDYVNLSEHSKIWSVELVW